MLHGCAFGKKCFLWPLAVILCFQIKPVPSMASSAIKIHPRNILGKKNKLADTINCGKWFYVLLAMGDLYALPLEIYKEKVGKNGIHYWYGNPDHISVNSLDPLIDNVEIPDDAIDACFKQGANLGCDITRIEMRESGGNPGIALPNGETLPFNKIWSKINSFLCSWKGRNKNWVNSNTFKISRLGQFPCFVV